MPQIIEVLGSGGPVSEWLVGNQGLSAPAFELPRLKLGTSASPSTSTSQMVTSDAARAAIQSGTVASRPSNLKWYLLGGAALLAVLLLMRK